METAVKIVCIALILVAVIVAAVGGAVLGGVMGFFVFPAKLYSWLVGEAEPEVEDRI